MSIDREKEIRADTKISGYMFTPEDVKELLAEIDRLRAENKKWEDLNEMQACEVNRIDVSDLREKLAIAVEALEHISKISDTNYLIHICEEALRNIK